MLKTSPYLILHSYMNPYLQFGSLQVGDKIKRLSDNKVFIVTKTEYISNPTPHSNTLINKPRTIYYFESEDKDEQFNEYNGKHGFIKIFTFTCSNTTLEECHSK